MNFTPNQLLRSIWERKLQRLLRVHVSLPFLMLLGTILIAVLGYIWIGSAFAMATMLPDDARLRGLFVISMFFSVLPVMFALIRSSSLRGDMNEALIALPIPAGTWIRLTTKYYYMSQMPVSLGFLVAIGLGAHYKAGISLVDAAGLAILMAYVAVAATYLARQLSRLALHKNRAANFIGSTVGFTALVVLVVYLTYRYAYRVESWDASIWSSWDFLSAVAVGSLFAGIGWAMQEYIHDYEDRPMQLSDDSVRVGLLARGSARVRKQSLLTICAKVMIRDKKFWIINSVNLLLVGFMAVLANRMHSVSFNSFIASFLPTLLLIGLASHVVEVRGALGSSRSSIYYLPISMQRLVLTLTALGLIVGGISVLLLSAGIQRVFLGQVESQLLVRLACTLVLSVQAAVLTSVLFFESKKDVGRGVLAGVVLFILLWPVLVSADILRQKDIWTHIGVAGICAVLTLGVTAYIERRMTLAGGA